MKIAYNKPIKMNINLESNSKSSKSIQKKFGLEFVILIINCTFAPLNPKFGNRNGMFN